MKQLLRVSEAAGLALHAMALLAGKEDQWRSTRRLAEALQVSERNLARVMWQLKKSGLLESVMGPRGGYQLAKPGARISLLDIYEATEGRFPAHACMLKKRACAGKNCILGDYLEMANHQFRQYLAGTKLADFKDFHKAFNLGRA